MTSSFIIANRNFILLYDFITLDYKLYIFK